MEEYILHELIKVKEINNLESSYRTLQEFNSPKKQTTTSSDYLKSKKYIFDEERMENNIIKLDTLINLLKENKLIDPWEIINEIIIPNFMKNTENFNIDNKLNDVYLSILNELLVFLNYSIYEKKNLDENIFIYVWTYFYKKINILDGKKSLKIILLKNLNYSLTVLLKRIDKYSRLYFEIQDFVLRYLNEMIDKKEIIERNLLILFDYYFRQNLYLFEELKELDKSYSNIFGILNERLENNFYYILKILIKLYDSPTTYDNIFTYIIKYCGLLQNFEQKPHNSFLYFFKLVINHRMNEINKNFEFYKKKKMFLFSLTKNLVNFMSENKNLKLLFANSDFLGETPGICDIFVRNTIDLFKNLMSNLEESSEIKSLSKLGNKILDAIRKNITKKIKISTIDNTPIKNAFNFLQDANKNLKNAKKYMKFYKKASNLKDPIIFYFMNNNFKGTILTDLIGREEEESQKLRKNFLKFFDFKNLKILDALRMFFLVFQMKGETQQIERILIEFSEKYKIDNEEGKFSADHVFTLTFAFLMLNTDSHKKEVEKKMTFEEFLRTVRYVADSSLLEDDEVEEIYYSIKKSEIKYFEIEKMKQKPDIFSEFDWKFVVDNQEKIQAVFLKQFLPSDLYEGVKEVWNDVCYKDDIIDFKLKELFEFNFFDNLKFVFENNMFNYELVNIIIDFFQKNEDEVLNQKLYILLNFLLDIIGTNCTVKELWVFESLFHLLINLLDKNDYFLDLFCEVFFQQFDIINFCFEDFFLDNLTQKINFIKRNHKHKIYSQEKSSFAGIFKTFLKDFTDNDENEKLEEIQKKNFENKNKDMKFNPSKNLISKFIKKFIYNEDLFEKLLISLYHYVVNKNLDNFSILIFVYFLHILKTIVDDKKNNKMKMSFLNFLNAIEKFNPNIDISNNALFRENVDFLKNIIKIDLYLTSNKITKFNLFINISKEEKIINNSNIFFIETPSEQNKEKKFFEDDLTKESIDLNNSESEKKQSIDSNNSENEKKEINQNSSKINLLENKDDPEKSKNIEKIKKLLRKNKIIKNFKDETIDFLENGSLIVFNYFLRDFIAFLSDNNRNGTNLFEIIELIYSKIISKNKKKLEEIIDFKNNIHIFLTKSLNIILKEDFDINIFLTFKIIDNFKEIDLKIDLYTFYFPIIDFIDIKKKKNPDLNSNRVLFLTFEKLSIESIKDISNDHLRTLLLLLLSLIKNINYQNIEIGKIDFILNSLLNFENNLYEMKKKEYNELLESLTTIFYKSAERLNNKKILYKPFKNFLANYLGYMKNVMKDDDVEKVLEIKLVDLLKYMQKIDVMECLKEPSGDFSVMVKSIIFANNSDFLEEFL